jgi:DNA-binding SARP family transcriptional activator/tetratricopeptide (TPR) repeat protein
LLTQIGILGPLVVHVDGSPVAVRGRRQRALLALLLIHANDLLIAERIIDLLWDGTPPRTASNTLQAHIARLRRVLPASGEGSTGRDVGRLTTRPSGYVLEIDDNALDSLLFERLTVRARSKTANGHHADAEANLVSALALWRGPALVEFATESFARDEAARLDKLRVDAAEAWAAAGLACGRGQELVTSLVQLVEQNPLREDLAAHLMVALYRSGRQADSLATFRDLRLRLRDDLGIDPSPKLQRLEESVLQQKSELLPTPPQGLEVRPRRTTTAMPRQALVDGPPFTGREADLAWLAEAWVRARRREAGLAIVRGEPGVGKTRLVAAFATRCHDEGVTVLWGRCSPEPLVPFQALAEALRPILPEGMAPESLWELGTRGEDEAGHRDDLNIERYLMFEAIAGLLNEEASTSPVLLVLDDIHWVDRPTLALLSHLLRSARESSLVVVATSRTTEAGSTHDLDTLFAELNQEGLAASHTLSGLVPAEVTTLINAIAGERTPPEFDEAIHTRTDGNPLFVTELLRHIGDTTGGRFRYGDADTADLARLGVPEGIRTVIGQRLARLDPMTIRVVEVAAVIGRDVDTDLVAAVVAEVDRSMVARALDQAEGAGLLRIVEGSGSSYLFVHELIKEAIEAGLGSARRALLHHQVGEALETGSAGSKNPPLAQLALHYAKASTKHDTAKAIVYAALAADRALNLLAYEDAVTHLELAFELCLLPGQEVDDTFYVDLLLLRARAVFASGDDAQAKTDFEQVAETVRRLKDAARMTDLALAATGTAMRHMWSEYGTVSPWVVELLEEALLLVGPADSSARARLLARLAEELYFSRDGGTRTAFAEDAVAIARRVDDERTLAEALSGRLRSQWEPETAVERLATADELLQLAVRCDDAELVMSAHAWRIGLRLELCQHDGIDDEVAEYSALVASYRSPRHQVWSRAILAGRALVRGDFEETERVIADGLAIAPELFGYAVQGFAGQLCTLRIEQGRADEVLGDARSFADGFPQVVAWRAGLSVILAELGHFEDARAEMSRVVGQGLGTLRRDQEWLFTMGALAETCALLADASTAADIYELLSPFAERAIVLGEGYVLWCSAQKSLGILARTIGDHEEACRHLVRALEIHRAFAAPPLVARTTFEYARALHAADGPAARVNESLEAARTLATSLGQTGLVHSIEKFGSLGTG